MVSGPKDKAYKFVRGRHILVSFAYKDWVKDTVPFCSSFIVDNGAFTIWKQGKGEVDFEGYYEWVRNLAKHPGFDWCLIPDSITGGEQVNQDLVRKWLRIGPKFEGVPVWHFHESFDWLEYLTRNFYRVALGSSEKWKTPGSKLWWERFTEIMGRICDGAGRPKCKIHGLRMLSPAIFSKAPFSSADSSNASMNAGSVKRFGMYLPVDAASRANVIADRIESYTSCEYWDETRLKSLSALLEEISSGEVFYED